MSILSGITGIFRGATETMATKSEAVVKEGDPAEAGKRQMNRRRDQTFRGMQRTELLKRLQELLKEKSRA
jgi:hypothetical protein